MDIEGFYDADPRRRASAEIELGSEWRDRAGSRYELSWVADTGELYVMREMAAPEIVDPFGDVFLEDLPVDQLTVAVLGTVGAREELEQIFDGWAEQMPREDSVSWIVRRLHESGVRTAPEDVLDPPSPTS